MPVGNCRCRPPDDLTSYSLISCQVTFLLDARNVSDTVIWLHPIDPTTTRGQKTFRLPGVTHEKVLPKELCYLNL